MRKVLIRLIEHYQQLGGGATLFAAECNFTPSCSEYAKIAIRDHGTFRGAVMSVGRILRCRDRETTVRKCDRVPPRGKAVASLKWQ